MALDSNTSPLIINLRSGFEGDEYVPYSNVPYKIINGIVQLDEIPDRNQKVTVTDPNGTTLFYETTSNSALADNKYFVNYTTGMIYFAQAAEGKTLLFSFYGRGVAFHPVDRVWTQQENGQVTETLGTIIQAGRDGIDNINTLNTLVNDTHAATTDVLNAKDQIITDVTDTKVQLIAETENAVFDMNTHRDSFKYDAADYSATKQYIVNNQVTYNGKTYIAIQDTIGHSPADTVYWRVFASGADSLRKTKTWTTTSDMTDFDISDVGRYAVGTYKLEVIVGGSPQINGVNFDEISPTLFRFRSSLPAGLNVVARWFDGDIGTAAGHNAQHRIGGGDELYASSVRGSIYAANLLHYGGDNTGSADCSSALLAAINDPSDSVFIPKGVYLISQNVSIPSGEKLLFDRNARFKIASGKTLTINGAIEAHSSDWIFDISLGGTVAGTPKVKEIYPQWFGAKGDDGATNDTQSFLNAINLSSSSGIKVFIPDGNYVINDMQVTGDFFLRGNGKKSVIKCGKITALANIDLDSVRFVSSTVKNGDPAGSPAVPWGNLFLFGHVSAYHDAVIRNCYLEFATVSENVLALHAQYYNSFTFENNYVSVGGIEVDYTNRVRCRNNTHDMKWINNNEVYHFNRYAEDIVVDGNTVYSTKIDFIDLYANGKHATISNNIIYGSLGYVVEVKTLFRDADMDFGSSTILGSINNVTFENNRFIDLRFPYVFNVNTIDYRAVPVNNDVQYYSRNMRFVGNYFEYTTNETSSGSPYFSSTSCVVFFVSGGFAPIFERNIVRSSAFVTTYLVAFESNNQKTFYPIIEGNQMIPNEYGATVPSNMLALAKVNSGVVSGLIKDNIMYGQTPIYLKTEAPSVQFELDGNIAPNLNESYFGYAARYSIEATSDAADVDLTVRGMQVNNVSFANTGKAKVRFDSCTINGARSYFSSTGAANEYHFENCDIPSTELRFGGGIIALLVMRDCIFRGTSNLLRGVAAAITRYYSTNNAAPNLLGSTVWNSASTIIPTKADDSTKF